jgi:diguanylate cyclase (GGDEF)-like protein
VKAGFFSLGFGRRRRKEKEKLRPDGPLEHGKMNSRQILILNPDPTALERLAALCGRYGNVSRASSIDEAASLLEANEFRIAVLDDSRPYASVLRGCLKKSTGILITGRDEGRARALAAEWPADYFVATLGPAGPDADEAPLFRTLERALADVELRMEAGQAKQALAGKEAKLKEITSEIREIKGLINENFIRELEKRIAIEAKYSWFQRERKKIEILLRKIYAANDVSSLLDLIADIKELVQAGGATIYVLDENEALGKYLKPLVWDDGFLSHPDFSKYIAPLDQQDFAAVVARHGQEINIRELGHDRRLSRRYIEHLKTPLRSLMGVPIMADAEVIGVVEVYNKISGPGAVQPGFSREDQEILRGLSEHIAIAMTKLNLIQYDALTGLLRPDPFFEKVIQKINSQSKRRREEGSCAMVMGDVDWFKNFNDRNGHEAGNKLLRELAGVLKLSIREDDLLCRYGGEEFLFFLTGVESLEEACVLTDRIRKNVEDHYFELQEFQPRNNLTMSFGVTMCPRSKLETASKITKGDMRILASEADVAMAEAKGKKSHEPGSEGTDERVLVKNKVCSYSRNWNEERLGGTIQTFKEISYREKRKHERALVSTILIFREDGAFKVTKTVNLSGGGVRILSEAPLPVTQTIELILVLGAKANTIKSDVVYSEKAGGESPYYYTGLRFRDLTAAQQKALDDYLRGFRTNATAN